VDFSSATAIPGSWAASSASAASAELLPVAPLGAPVAAPSPIPLSVDAGVVPVGVGIGAGVGGVGGMADAIGQRGVPIEPGRPQPAAASEHAGATTWDRFVEELITWFKTLASAAVYATLIVTFIFQVARVEGQSMEPTLANQDRLIVNKLIYRISEPRRGDIVMLYYPLNPDKSFVKRVIAEAGDEVHIVDGRVYVNDVPLKDDYVPAQFRSHEDYGPIRVKEGYYFVMGDHRNNSSDSRHWGEVPKKYIIGKVQVRWWPLPTAKVFE
jgi:signal peptidase I